jgi:hypothetical protein
VDYNDLRVLWLEKVFKKHIMACTIRKYQLLILDGHASHELAEFNLFCKNRQISLFIYLLIHQINCNLLMLAALHP